MTFLTLTGTFILFALWQSTLLLAMSLEYTDNLADGVTEDNEVLHRLAQPSMSFSRKFFLCSARK